METTPYPKMYAIVCGAASDAIDLLSAPEGVPEARLLLEKALLSAEELYLNHADSALSPKDLHLSDCV